MEQLPEQLSRWPLSHVLDRCSRRGSTSSIHGVVCFAAPARPGAMEEMQKDCLEQSLPEPTALSRPCASYVKTSRSRMS